MHLKTVFIASRRPQPSDSPDDPLNWSQWKKHILLFVISATAFLPDYGGAMGAVALIPQAVDWNMTQEGVLQALVGNVFVMYVLPGGYPDVSPTKQG